MLHDSLTFKLKSDTVAGLELADLLAPPIATRTLQDDEDAEAKPLWQAAKTKIWLRGDNLPGGVGLKTFPGAHGRSIMNVPLKASEGP